MPLAFSNMGKGNELGYANKIIMKLRRHQPVDAKELEELECFIDGVLERIKIERRKLNVKK